MKVLHFEEIDSTSIYIKNNYEKLEDFSIVSADYQTAGKGRNDRKWISPKKENVMFSILIKDIDIINRFSELSLFSCLIIREYLEQLGLEKVEVKWPNDVYINGKKVCGILLEGQLPNYICVGIGLNVNQSNFDGEYRIQPTSVKNELGETLDLNLVRDDLFNKLIDDLLDFKDGNINVIEEFNKYNYLKDKNVSFIYENNKLIGTVQNVLEDGRIEIISEGKSYQINSGEINLL